MSSHINSAKHFKEVQCTIAAKIAFDNDFCLPYAILEAIPNLRKHRTNPERIEQIVRAVFENVMRLQVLCVNLQYQHLNKPGETDMAIEFQTADLMKNTYCVAYKDLNDVELYKALQCILYQTELEHLTNIRELTPEEEKSMLFIREFKSAIGEDIIRNLEQYEKAPWSRE